MSAAEAGQAAVVEEAAAGQEVAVVEGVAGAEGEEWLRVSNKSIR